MNDDELSRRISDHLEAGNAQLDGATRARLSHARHRAMLARHRTTAWYLPAMGGVALASLVAVMVWTGRTPEPIELNSANDFEMLTQGDSIELYQDMEFLQWLEGESNGVI